RSSRRDRRSPRGAPAVGEPERRRLRTRPRRVAEQPVGALGGGGVATKLSPRSRKPSRVRRRLASLNAAAYEPHPLTFPTKPSTRKGTHPTSRAALVPMRHNTPYVKP